MSRMDPRLEALAVQGMRAQTPDLSDEDFELVIESETNFTEAVRVVVLRREQDKAHVSSLKDLIKTLRERLDRLENRVQWWSGLIQGALETAGLRKVELDVATVSIGKGQPNVLVTDEALIPMSLRKADPRVQEAFYQLLRASNYAAANDHPEMAADFKGTAQGLLPYFVPDRKAIADKLKADEEVPGCQLSNAAPHLLVRVR